MNNVSISSLLGADDSWQAPKPEETPSRLEHIVSRFRAPILAEPEPEEVVETTVLSVSDHIKRYQTSLNLTPPVPVPVPAPALSKTSIHSIINADPEPKKKKRKEEKKKRPVVSSVAAGQTTDKSIRVPKVSLPKPTVVDLLNNQIDTKPAEDTKPTEDSKGATNTKGVTNSTNTKGANSTDTKGATNSDKPDKDIPMPIIALDIPLVDPKDPQPGKSEVVVNVLRLSEEKYGWAAVHPKSKNAIDVMDDMIDDDDDDDDDDIVVEEERPNRKGLSEEQLVKQHEARMNRKVGKYDFEDPFIDDIELQMEEEIISTKEGFFVYWGPLVDDRAASKKKKK